MSYYFLARISVHDPQLYRRYETRTDDVLRRYGGQVLAVDEDVVLLEGEWSGTRTVLIRFPDEDAARAWYDSPEYRAIAQHRWHASSADAVLLRGRDEVSPN